MGIELLDNSNILTTSDCRIAANSKKILWAWQFLVTFFWMTIRDPFVKAVEVK